MDQYIPVDTEVREVAEATVVPVVAHLLIPICLAHQYQNQIAHPECLAHPLILLLISHLLIVSLICLSSSLCMKHTILNS